MSSGADLYVFSAVCACWVWDRARTEAVVSRQLSLATVGPAAPSARPVTSTAGGGGGGGGDGGGGGGGGAAAAVGGPRLAVGEAVALAEDCALHDDAKDGCLKPGGRGGPRER